MAKKDSSHMSLASQLAEHSIIRKYIAIVYNNFTEDEGRFYYKYVEKHQHLKRNNKKWKNIKKQIKHSSACF